MTVLEKAEKSSLARIRKKASVQSECDGFNSLCQFQAIRIYSHEEETRSMHVCVCQHSVRTVMIDSGRTA